MGSSICSWKEYVGFCIFLIGSWLNFYPEWKRNEWKKRQENTGKLYTGGMFALARHVNYTGEIMSFVGFAMVSGLLLNLWIPLVMAFCMM